MGDNYIYIPETDSWSPVELNSAGFPIIEDEAEDVMSDNALLQPAIFNNCEEMAKTIPVGDLAMAIFDCDSMQWVSPDNFSTREHYSSKEQEWPSWYQDEDGLWYAPVDPPEKNATYAWDEISQQWIEIKLISNLRDVSEIQRFKSWVQSEDGLWRPPVPMPDGQLDVVWYEPELRWATINEIREKNSIAF